MKRLSWDDFGMAIAQSMAMRADCRRMKVGAVILSEDHRVLGGGYNGSPAGEPGCLDGHCPRGLLSMEQVPAFADYDSGPGRCISIHAEVNAIIYSDPVARLSGTMYSTYKPCPTCFKVIRGSGLDRAVWPEGEWTRKVVAGGGTQEAKEELVGPRADGPALEGGVRNGLFIPGNAEDCC